MTRRRLQVRKGDDTVGVLAMDDHGTLSFRYDAEWLERADAWMAWRSTPTEDVEGKASTAAVLDRLLRA